MTRTIIPGFLLILVVACRGLPPVSPQTAAQLPKLAPVAVVTPAATLTRRPTPTATATLASRSTPSVAAALTRRPTLTAAMTLTRRPTLTAVAALRSRPTVIAKATVAPAASPTPMLGPRNVAMGGKASASWNSQDAGRIIDGNSDTLWNSEFRPPQWAAVLLDHPYLVSRIELVVAQTPAGKTSHEIWLEDTAGTLALYTTLHDISTVDGQTIEVPINPPRVVVRVMVRTIASPSFVAWREMRVFGVPPEPGSLAPAASPAWPAIQVRPFVPGGLTLPVAIVNAHDGSGRLFVLEQRGRIRVIRRDGTLLPTPFLDLHDHVSCCGELGLVGLVFPPDFPRQNYVYVTYTANEFGPPSTKIGDLVLARFRVTSNPDVADPKSQEVILTIPEPTTVHHSGHLAFGPDGYLYVGSGDGGPEDDPNNHGQDTNTLLGKILRIDVESHAKPYGIPPSNPFVNKAGYRPEIWAFGLRNPWSFSFDRKTGDLYIADVGQAEFEEVDVQPAASHGGENYGWRVMEGDHCFRTSSCGADRFVAPVVEYHHALGCAIVGGDVYRGTRYPQLDGIYVYSDYCSGTIWGLRRQKDQWQHTRLYEPGFPVTGIGTDEAGELYIADYVHGAIDALVATSP